jgi:hypothetical protein
MLHCLRLSACVITDKYRARCTCTQARKHLEQPEEFGKLVDPRLQSVNQESLGIVCNVANLCIDLEPSRRPSMSMIAAILEEGIEASAATLLRNSSLAWAEAELAIS